MKEVVRDILLEEEAENKAGQPMRSIGFRGFTAEDDSKVNINWVHTILLVGSPLLAIYGVCTWTFQWKTFALFAIMYYFTGMGITAGYHRYWAHKAYSATFPVELFLAVFGAGAFQGSIRWWCRNHRAHHRFTDTPKDPYNVRKGFMWAHLGWMLVKQNASRVGRADITDLDKQKLIRWQHKYYAPIAIFAGVILPTLIAGLCWGDYYGGFFIGAMCRMVFVHHATFFVNSLAHYVGEQGFSDLHTAYDSVITAVLTLGEGYHNFHHEFPRDYRNAIKFWQYDPTKWFIWALSTVGLTYDLQMISDNEIAKARVQMEQRSLDQLLVQMQHGRRVDKDLVEMDFAEFTRRCQGGEQLVIVENYVCDVTNFVDQHPGGRLTLLNYVGTDCTPQFRGKGGANEYVHDHTAYAEKFLLTMRVGRLTNSAAKAASRAKSA